MTSIAENLQATLSQIAKANPQPQKPVVLIAVSKSQPIDYIEKCFAAGQTIFGENYVQEAMVKIAALAHLPLQWHFIGPIQSNKAKQIAEYFDWVHSVDRFKIAQKLAASRPADKLPLNICLQVNVSGEFTKSGVAPAEVAELARQMMQLPNLRLRGLMAIPEPSEDPQQQRKQFHVMRELFDALNLQGFGLDTLSMGMSGDFQAAIAEGATHVRIGSAIFGERKKITQ
jgi:PLP dependent protein